MKTAIATVAALAVIGMSVPSAQAGGGWSTTGKVLTGVAGGLFLARALEPVPVYAAPAPVYVQQPAPVVYYQQVPVQQQVVVQQPVQTVQTVPQAQTVQPAPQIVVQQPTYVQPAPVYVQQPTVVYSAPVVYAAPAYYYAPRPVIGFHIGFGGPYYHYRHW